MLWFALQRPLRPFEADPERARRERACSFPESRRPIPRSRSSDHDATMSQLTADDRANTRCPMRKNPDGLPTRTKVEEPRRSPQFRRCLHSSASGNVSCCGVLNTSSRDQAFPLLEARTHRVDERRTIKWLVNDGEDLIRPRVGNRGPGSRHENHPAKRRRVIFPQIPQYR